MFCNFPNRNNNNLAFRFFKLASRAIDKSEKAMRLIDAWVERGQNRPDIILLRPSSQILQSVMGGIVDTNKYRINAFIDNGIKDAEKFLRANRLFLIYF